MTLPIPAATLGALLDRRDSSIVQTALAGLLQLHGGWGGVIFHVESSLVLPSGDADPPAEEGWELQPESLVVNEILQENFPGAAEALLIRCCETAAGEAVRSGDAVTMDGNLAGVACMVTAIPSIKSGNVRSVFCRVQEPQRRVGSAALSAMQTFTVVERLVNSREESQRLKARFSKTSAFVELPSAVSTGIDFAECARKLSNHLQEIFSCDLVALSLRSRRGHRLIAVSGETGPVESHTPGRRALLSHLSEAVHQKRILSYGKMRADAGAEGVSDDPRTLREWFSPSASLCLPLISRKEEISGAWLLLWKKSPEDWEEKCALAKAAAPEVGALIALLHQGKAGALLGPVLQLWNRATITGRKVLVTVAALLGLGALIPMPYPVRATCEIQPAVRRVIASPFDGTLLRTRVRAGQVVAEGDLLAEMDGRELRSEIASAVADREKARKKADQALAAGSIADARVSELEADALSHQLELLEYRRSHLEVRSPIAGLVLQGDLERKEGAPLRVGDPLFEVGPLDQLVAEIAVEAVDIPFTSAGSQVQMKFETYAGKVVKSTVSRVAPKSEWREEGNVFVCEAEVENLSGELRAGMKGKAKISGPWRPLAWVWCRDAWLSLRYRLW